MASIFDYLIPEIKELGNRGKNSHYIARKLSCIHGLNKNSLYDFIRKNKIIKINSVEKSLEEKDFSRPENWKHAWVKSKDGGPSIFVVNDESEITYEEVRDDIINEMKKYSPKYDKIQRVHTKNKKHSLTIDIADLHISKLATKSETGQSYNTKKAIKRALQGVAGILEKASGYHIDKIFFIIGNDVLHIDSINNTTTRGTRQDVDGMWYQAFTTARKLYVKILENLSQIADVHVIHCPSNHDYMSGYMLADSVASWFNKNPNITFDVSNNHRKYVKYGKSLLGFSHGDGAKMSDMPLLMANESKLLWAETSYRYIYLHHLHHKDVRIFQSGKDYQGATVEYLRSPSGTDGWHHKKGYSGNLKAIEGFIHSKEHGQVAKLIHLF